MSLSGYEPVSGWRDIKVCFLVSTGFPLRDTLYLKQLQNHPSSQTNVCRFYCTRRQTYFLESHQLKQLKIMHKKFVCCWFNICDCFLSCFIALASKRWPSASEATKSSKTSTQTSPSTSQNTTIHRSKLDQRVAALLSPSSLTHSKVDSFKLPQVLPPLTGSPYPVPRNQLSLRSSFTVTSVSQVHQKSAVDEGPESAMFPEQPSFSPLPLETVSPPEPPQSPFSKAESTRQTHQSVCEPESVLLANGSLLPESPLSSQNPPSTLEDMSPLVKSLSSVSLHSEFPLDEFSRWWSPSTKDHGPEHPFSVTQSLDEEDNLESGKWIKARTTR